MNNPLHITGTYIDLYQLTMAQGYFLGGNGQKEAVFDYFFRKLPFEGGYALFAGLENLLEILENLHFSSDDITYLRNWGFDARFLEYLKDFRFTGTIHSVPEGDIIFPIQPVLTVEGTILEAQIIETLLLNILNFQTLLATKASRMRQIAGDRTLIDFGMRRAQGPAAHYAARAVMIGGFNATSNVKSGMDFDLPVAGTMAHSFIQSFDDELTAFRHFANTWPENCILLVDTYNTLKSGIPNAIRVAKEMEAINHQLKGIRLDSGDLAYLSKQSRQLLDQAGLDYVKIFASNQLDEYVIRSLSEQNAPIDGFGVGTRLVTGQPDAALDGVYKLAFFNGKPRIKLSETITKTTLPHKKQVHRIFDRNHKPLGADIITLWDEADWHVMHHPYKLTKNMDLTDCIFEPLLHLVMSEGRRTNKQRSVSEIAEFSMTNLGQLPPEYKRFDNPHIYKVGLSTRLRDERDILVNDYEEETIT